MKLSVKPALGATRIRGGRVLRVSHEHQVSVKGYDRRPDDALRLPPRSFDAGWVTAAVGDLAVEVIAAKTERVLGYVYLSGAAINFLRYVDDADRALVAGWFSPGRGVRVTFASERLPAAEDFVRGMMEIKYGSADLAVTCIEVSEKAAIAGVAQVLATAYGYASDDRERGATADFVAKIFARGVKDVGVVHFQTPGRAQAYACQPFSCEVLLSSPALESRPFLAPAEASPGASAPT